MSRQNYRGSGLDDDDADVDIGGMDARRRATLLESEAEELRLRLDNLLAEIGRHGRPDPAEVIRRYAVPATIAIVIALTGIAATVAWRRNRRVAVAARLLGSMSGRLSELASSLV
jgi:hypothetical protein